MQTKSKSRKLRTRVKDLPKKERKLTAAEAKQLKAGLSNPPEYLAKTRQA